MTALQSIPAKLIQSLERLGNTRQLGWFGVDIGTSAVKIAQIEKVGGRWRAVTTLVIPNCDLGPFDEEKLRNGELLKLLAEQFTRRSGFSLQAAACLLPMSTVDYRCLRLPAASEDDLYQMARQEMEDETSTDSAPRVFDLWASSAEGQDAEGMQEMAAISVDESVVASVADNLTKVGLKCGVVDGLPFALARATTMALPALGDAPIAIVDWGNHSTTFTVARKGYPWFTRVLRCKGAGSLVERLSERLRLGQAECWHLLDVYGVSSLAGDVVTSELKQAVSQTLVPDLQCFTREIQTTLAYLKQQHSELYPQKTLLTGGGATIRGVTTLMEELAGLEIDVWQLNGPSGDEEQTDDRTLALFAPSLALSALGLEE
ncbi:MAG: pilus assembly protein PilM [Pirellulaceae bacterium]|nr:pilus assembly protein PilM [Pirellulaceae bacterium]